MAAHSRGSQVGQPSCPIVDRFYVDDIDAELVVAQSGSNIRMCHRVHIRVDSHGKFRFDSQAARQRIDEGKLSFGLTIEAMDSVAKGVFYLGGRFADTGED